MQNCAGPEAGLSSILTFISSHFTIVSCGDILIAVFDGGVVVTSTLKRVSNASYTLIVV